MYFTVKIYLQLHTLFRLFYWIKENSSKDILLTSDILIHSDGIWNSYPVRQIPSVWPGSSCSWWIKSIDRYTFAVATPLSNPKPLLIPTCTRPLATPPRRNGHAPIFMIMIFMISPAHSCMSKPMRNKCTRLFVGLVFLKNIFVCSTPTYC